MTKLKCGHESSRLLSYIDTDGSTYIACDVCGVKYYNFLNQLTDKKTLKRNIKLTKYIIKQVNKLYGGKK